MKTISVAAITSLITTAVFMFIIHSNCGEGCHKSENGHGTHASCDAHHGEHASCDHHKGCSKEGHSCCKSKCSHDGKCKHSVEGCSKTSCTKEGKKCAGEGSCNKTKCTKKVEVEVIETDTVQ